MDALAWKMRNRSKLKGALVLARRPRENALLGLVETSLFMNWSPARVRFWWTDIVSNAALDLTFEVDGMNDADAHAQHTQRQNPDWEIKVWEAHDPNLPVVVDWDGWLNAVDKYGHRNPAFTMKG